MARNGGAEETVGERIRRLRAGRGWTQEDLASKAGVGQSEISKWETGQQDITLPNLVKVAQAFGVRPADLFEPGGARQVDFERGWRAAIEQGVAELRKLKRLAPTPESGLLDAAAADALVDERVEGERPVDRPPEAASG